MSRRLLSPALAALAFAIALLQRPGDAVADTKIDLHVDPLGFLGEVASVWSDSGGLGQVQAGQYSGYLFPMGPFFALGDLLGLPPWLVQRLWLGLAAGARGLGHRAAARRAARRASAAPAHLVAGLLVLLNPYVVVFANRTSVTLLGYAALPWLLLIVQRGVRDPRRLLVGGGVRARARVDRRRGQRGGDRLDPARPDPAGGLRGGLRARCAGATWAPSRCARRRCRCSPRCGGSCRWRRTPRYGLNFLPFTEAPGSIWDTTSLSESLRLLGLLDRLPRRRATAAR